jgi:hypothetical protein
MEFFFGLGVRILDIHMKHTKNINFKGVYTMNNRKQIFKKKSIPEKIFLIIMNIILSI